VVKMLTAGDTALTIEFGDAATRELSAQVLALDRLLASTLTLPGIVETVPTMRSLTIYYDPLVTSQATLAEAVTPLLNLATSTAASGRLWTLPVCYEPSHAPDLAEVGATTGLSAAEVIRLHTSVVYRVYMLGFLPGQAYLGDLAPALHLPRRTTPRTAVPPGSVAIATSMATVYPLESPGGWHLIGRCPVPMFDPAASSPVLLAPADDVRFRAVNASEFEALTRSIQSGTWQIRPEPLP
jgi:inhibitor of KinA